MVNLLDGVEAEVSAELVSEINSLSKVTGDVVPSYEPQAFNHEGHVD